MDAVMDVLKKIGEWLGTVDWAKVFETVKDVVTKIVEWISSLAA